MFLHRVHGFGNSVTNKGSKYAMRLNTELEKLLSVEAYF